MLAENVVRNQRTGRFIYGRTSTQKKPGKTNYPNRQAAFQEVIADVQKNFPGYTLDVVMDTDFSEG